MTRKDMTVIELIRIVELQTYRNGNRRVKRNK